MQNVAWRNPDGSKALIAHNGGTVRQSVRVNWGNQSFVYTLPARTTATFTWSGTRPAAVAAAARAPARSPASAGKCVDVAGASTANGTAVQLYTCNGTAAQQWTRGSDGTLRALGKCLDIAGPSTANGTLGPPVGLPHRQPRQKWTYNGAASDLVNQFAGKCLDVTGNNSADGTRLQIWTCTGGRQPEVERTRLMPFADGVTRTLPRRVDSVMCRLRRRRRCVAGRR